MQTTGVLSMDINKLGTDAIGFTGHRRLLGAQGIGGFIISDKLAEKVDLLIEGGTSSLSSEGI